MALLRKPEVFVYKDTVSAETEAKELKELAGQAKGDLKAEINKQIYLLEKGIMGEDEILFQLKYSGMDLIVFRDANLSYEDLTAQIDYYVVAPKCRYIIECKNLYGNITINRKGDFIRSYEYNGKTVKEGIESPLSQNERHRVVLKNKLVEANGAIRGKIVAKYFDDNYKSIVVMANKKTILDDRYAPKDIRDNVIRADQLVATIKKIEKSSDNYVRSAKEMMKVADSFNELLNESNNTFIEKYKELVNQQAEDASKKVDTTDNSGANDNICPRCGAQLVLRNGKRGEFYGCSSFPKCRFTKDLTD